MSSTSMPVRKFELKAVNGFAYSDALKIVLRSPEDPAKGITNDQLYLDKDIRARLTSADGFIYLTEYEHESITKRLDRPGIWGVSADEICDFLDDFKNAPLVTLEEVPTVARPGKLELVK